MGLVDDVPVAVGVGGTSAGMPVEEPGVYFPMNHEGTQPRSPVSSLMAYRSSGNMSELKSEDVMPDEAYSRMTSGCNA